MFACRTYTLVSGNNKKSVRATIYFLIILVFISCKREIENENATDINNYKINWTKKTLKKVFLGYNVNPTPCN